MTGIREPAMPRPGSDTLSHAFARAFGGPPALVARAPGRVNLIGEHTDYHEGFVLPVAIGVETLVAARPRTDRSLRIRATDYADAEVTFALDAPFAHDPAQDWADYPRAMAAVMVAGGHPLPGADLAISGTIPRGAGLSSSASLCVAVGTALAALAGLELTPVALARMAQAAENAHVGTQCGIMDQLAVAAGVAGHALLIDCREPAYRPIALPADLAILIVHSGVSRQLVDGAYNERRAQSEAAARAMGVQMLRDADADMLAAAAPRLDALALRRGRHIISENARVLAAAAALEAGDLRTLGELMAASHASMRDDFAITVPPIDALAAELHALIGGEGGARMTGGGFGGAVVALCRRARAAAVIAGLTYRCPDGTPPHIFTELASDGASILPRREPVLASPARNAVRP